MHELSICQNIVDSILQEMDAMEKRPKRLVSARIVAGELRQIVPEFMHDAYRIITGDTPIAGSQLEIRLVPKRCTCRDCGWSGDLHFDEYECGKCSGCSLTVEGGTELYLENLEVEY